LFWFKELLDEIGHDKAALIMHTEPDDPHGQPLDYLINELDLGNGQAMLSTVKMEPHRLAEIYNMADCTINISDAEGFGLSTFESLSCETPIIVTMTGGLQEQVTDGESWFGIGIEPSSKTVIGSQEVPWIYEDRLAKDDFISACKKMLNLSKESRAEMGAAGRKHVLKNYGYERYVTEWDKTLTETYEECGSWENRKKYCSWEFKEVA
jgi:glycosyltransferase involved in cell wall biosynthesis